MRGKLYFIQIVLVEQDNILNYKQPNGTNWFKSDFIKLYFDICITGMEFSVSFVKKISRQRAIKLSKIIK